MSPRVVPHVTVDPVEPRKDAAGPDNRYIRERAANEHGNQLRRCSIDEPYMPGCPHSFYRDVLHISAEAQRDQRALERAQERGGSAKGDPEIPTVVDRSDSLEAARRRLGTVKAPEARARWYGELRDLSSSGVPDVLRPSAPGWLAEIYGQASRQVGRLAAALERRPIEPGQVDMASGVPVLTIPRLATGAAVAVQASENAAVQETDPTSASYSAPVAAIAGNVDMSRQAFDRSRPGLDEAISEDLGRATGVTLDSQLVSGSGASGQLRGLVNVSGILTATTAATTVQGQLSAIWNGFNVLAGSTGFGNPDPDGYLTIMHPRRFDLLAELARQALPEEPDRAVLARDVECEDRPVPVRRRRLAELDERPRYGVPVVVEAPRAGVVAVVLIR